MANFIGIPEYYISSLRTNSEDVGFGGVPFKDSNSSIKRTGSSVDL